MAECDDSNDVEIITDTLNHESDKEIQATVTWFVDRLTGKRTIYQMIHLSKDIEKRGGNPSDQIIYKQIYHDRLMNHIQNRIDNLRTKTIQSPVMMVPGALDILKFMQIRGEINLVLSYF